MLAWARVVSRREEKRGDELWDRASAAHAATAASIDGWLAGSYGAAMVLRGKLDSSNSWMLTSAGGGQLEGRFIETAPGTIELRKATVADTDESVYFKPVLPTA